MICSNILKAFGEYFYNEKAFSIDSDFNFLFLPAARTAVLSFMKAKETSTREKDLFRSVKVKKLTAF